jgi:glucan phosphoethanolaminetransferase (alkaline phosphatase superfamily)
MANVIGLAVSLGILGAIYAKKIHSSFKYLWISALILIPSAIFLIFKISFAQWFDRNDAGHLLIVISLFMYYQTIKNYETFLIKNKKSPPKNNIFMDNIIDKPRST